MVEFKDMRTLYLNKKYSLIHSK